MKEREVFNLLKYTSMAMGKDMFLKKLKAVGEGKGMKAPDGFGVDVTATEVANPMDMKDMSLEDHVRMMKEMPNFDVVEIIKLLVKDDAATETADTYTE